MLPGRLSVSRSIGDAPAKIARLGGNPNVMSATPEVKAYRITTETDFIIIASDGIYDRMTNYDIV